ncbi:MAG: MarR family transcriptional regulator [Pseudomonadota bacterium]
MNDEMYMISALRLLQSADELRDRVSGAFAAVHGLSVNEFFLLMHLERAADNRLPRVELAKRMYVSASTITRMVGPMQKIGLVDRESSARDARLAFVALNETGKNKLQEAKLTFAKNAGYAFEDRWQIDDVSILSELLHRFVAGRIANLT